MISSIIWLKNGEPYSGIPVFMNTTNDKSAETTKPEETTKLAETTKPEEMTKPVETTKPAETTKPVETTKPMETTKPAETTKAAETTGSAEINTPPDQSNLPVSEEENPQTGDKTDLAFGIVLTSISALGLAATGLRVFFWKKRRIKFK